MKQSSSELSYEAILLAVKDKIAELKPLLPLLPTDEELKPFIQEMHDKDRRLIEAAQHHVEKKTHSLGHGFAHLEWVAANGAYVTAWECEVQGIQGELRQEIVQRAWRLGYLHDLERWRGFQRVHAVEGQKVAQEILNDLGIKDDFLPEMVLVHDDMEIESKSDPRFDLPLFCDFAVDHVHWGLEREEEK